MAPEGAIHHVVIPPSPRFTSPDRLRIRRLGPRATGHALCGPARAGLKPTPLSRAMPMNPVAPCPHAARLCHRRDDPPPRPFPGDTHPCGRLVPPPPVAGPSSGAGMMGDPLVRSAIPSPVSRRGPMSYAANFVSEFARRTPSHRAWAISIRSRGAVMPRQGACRHGMDPGDRQGPAAGIKAASNTSSGTSSLPSARLIAISRPRAAER